MLAIVWREFKVAISSPVVLIFHLLTPLFLLVFFASVLASNLRTFSYSGIQVSYFDFFTPGLAGYVTFMGFSLALTFVRQEKVSGLLNVTALARGSLVGYVSGKLTAQTILNFAKAAMLLVVAAVMSSGTSHLLRIPNLFIFVTTLAMGSVVWLSLGIALATIIRREDLRDVTVTLLTLPLVFSSSMYYDISQAPSWIRAISRINPLTYTCNGLRAAYLVDSVNYVSTDQAVLALMFLISLVSVFAITRRYRS